MMLSIKVLRQAIPKYMKTKECTYCKQLKDVSCFYISRRDPSGLQKRCKDCCSEYAKIYRIKNRKILNKNQRNFNKSQKGKVLERNKHLKKKYSMDIGVYNNMLSKQNNVCAICKNKCKKNKNLSVDHSHSTGNIRGLLCNDCNVGLGFFQDNILLLESAKNYLAQYT